MSDIKNLLILGATSAIAVAYAREVCKNFNVNFLLVARDAKKIEIVKNDLLARGASEVKDYILDFKNTDSFSHLINYIKEDFNEINEVLLAFATLPDNEALLSDSKALQEELSLNIISPLILLTEVSNIFKDKSCGTIIAISSVAGDRGRKSNFIYGATKSALSTYMSGLRNYLFDYNVKVINVKPGFVDTPMTSEIEKSKLFVKPEVIAHGIINAVRKEKDEVYLPKFWLLIMLIIRNIPEKIFKRLSI